MWGVSYETSNGWDWSCEVCEGPWFGFNFGYGEQFRSYSFWLGREG